MQPSNVLGKLNNFFCGPNTSNLSILIVLSKHPLVVPVLLESHSKISTQILY